ncbi:MAG: hypothetical protein EAZ13_08910 [Sphingobacteriia bacterium]|nr:MAG: hypothetical protein EAZ13_08910 [Sphingobacteriia bacterium]
MLMPQKDKPRLNFMQLNKMNPIWIILSYCCIIICGPKLCLIWGIYLVFGPIYNHDFLLYLPGTLGMILVSDLIFRKKLPLAIARFSGVLLLYIGLIVYGFVTSKETVYETMNSWPSFVSLFVFFTISILFLIATYQKYVNATKR